MTRKVPMINLSRPIRIAGGDGPPRYPVKEALGKLRGLLYHGHKVECSCCGQEFALFLFSPYQAALCPNCLSFERYRLLCRYLRDETDFGEREMKVLDIAPIWAFQEFCRSFDNVSYLSIDIESPMAMSHMDIRSLDLPDDTFDVVADDHVEGVVRQVQAPDVHVTHRHGRLYVDRQVRDVAEAPAELLECPDGGDVQDLHLALAEVGLVAQVPAEEPVALEGQAVRAEGGLVRGEKEQGELLSAAGAFDLVAVVQEPSQLAQRFFDGIARGAVPAGDSYRS